VKSSLLTYFLSRVILLNLEHRVEADGGLELLDDVELLKELEYCEI